MVHVLISVLLCGACWSSTTEVDFRVKGISLGSSHARVLRQLGRPVSSKREKIVDETCGPPYTFLRLRYEGAVVELHGDLQGRNFEVVSIEVSSSQLPITPGIKLGMSEQMVRAKLGSPWQTTNDSGLLILNYATKGNDGGAALYFRNDRLVKVHWQYTLC